MSDVVSRLTALALGGLLGLQAATQYVAWSFRFASPLGEGLPISDDARLYLPWAVLHWRAEFFSEGPRVFAGAGGLMMLGVALGLGVCMLLEPTAGRRRARGWGGQDEARRAGLRARTGCVIGELDGRLLVTADRAQRSSPAAREAAKAAATSSRACSAGRRAP